MRLFVALDLDPEIRQRIQDFVSRIRGLAPNARWISADSLHITLKFIGEAPDHLVGDIGAALSSVRCQQLQLRFSGTGFFPNPNSARVFWIGIQSGDGLTQLAQMIDTSLSGIGIPRESRSYSPHLTLARTSGGSGAPGRLRGDRPNRGFAKLQDFLGEHPAPDFGTMAAREFFLYRSRLSPKGSQYSKMERFELISADN